MGSTRGDPQAGEQGVDAIKLLSSGAVLEHGSNPNSQEFTEEELRAAVEEATVSGCEWRRTRTRAGNQETDQRGRRIRGTRDDDR